MTEAQLLADPIAYGRVLWPAVRLYDKQQEIAWSVEHNTETIVPAANMTGKDFIAAFVVLCLFLRACRLGQTCRIVTTSVKDDHLRVLWGEIGRFVRTSAVPLEAPAGPLIFNHRDIRLAREGVGGYCYVRGMVADRPEAMAGHHAQRTLFVADEASGIPNEYFTQAATWAKRLLIFGNCNSCPPSSYFRAAVRGGDILTTGW